MTNGNKEGIIVQINVYKKALLNAKNIETDLKWIDQYNNRLESLNKIIQYFDKSNSDEICIIIEQESRAYGWSYYPGNHGEQAESEFWKLKKLLTA